MALTDYAGLVAAISTEWMHRADLTATAPVGIALAEAKFNRRLRTKHQELALSETAIDASYQVAIPSNFRAVKRIWRTDDPKTPLGVKTLEFIIKRQAAGQLALNYCVEDAKFRFDGTGSVAGILYRNIPALTGSNTTNWLLTAEPDVYLFNAMEAMCKYTKDFTAAQYWGGLGDAAIAELNKAEQRDQFSGPLVVRSA